jgi:hypothetical protein
MKPPRSLAAFAIAAGLVYASGAAAAAAPAAATAPIHASASSAVEPLHADALPPAPDCAIAGSDFRTYYDGCAHWSNYACVALHHFNITPPNYVSDGCAQAVDLLSGENETGHAICIPSGSASGYLHTAWHSFEITGSGAC